MKKAYLTIDDAPSRDFAGKMEFLHRRGIPALFFCEGRYIQQRERELCVAIERGFLIGNHSFGHPRFSDLSLEECKREILHTDELIDYLYRRMGQQRPAKYFRFPYLDGGGNAGSAMYAGRGGPASELYRYEEDGRYRELQKYLWELGYRQPQFEGIDLKYFSDQYLLTSVDVRCTYDQAEYWLHKTDAPCGLSTEAAILARIEEDLPYEGRSLNCEDTVDIVLVHDHEHTTHLWYRIMERYIEKGIQFMRIPAPNIFQENNLSEQ